jgi:WD40 repeat protein
MLWDARSGERLLNLSDHRDSVTKIAFSPDGTKLATASFDGTARVWDGGSGEERLTLGGYGTRLQDVVFSPDGGHLVTASEDGTVRAYVLDIEELMALARERVTRALTAEECERYLHRETCALAP